MFISLYWQLTRYLIFRNIEYHIFGTFVQQIMLLLIGYLTFYFELADFAVRKFRKKNFSTNVWPGPYHGEFDLNVSHCDYCRQHPVNPAGHPIPQDDWHLALCCHQHDGLPPHLAHLYRIHPEEGQLQWLNQQFIF